MHTQCTSCPWLPAARRLQPLIAIYQNCEMYDFFSSCSVGNYWITVDFLAVWNILQYFPTVSSPIKKFFLKKKHRHDIMTLDFKNMLLWAKTHFSIFECLIVLKMTKLTLAKPLIRVGIWNYSDHKYGNVHFSCSGSFHYMKESCSHIRKLANEQN